LSENSEIAIFSSVKFAVVLISAKVAVTIAAAMEWLSATMEWL
jgi:hypothetical protein